MSEYNGFDDELNGDLEVGAFSDGYVHFDERQDVLASLDLLKLITPLLDECPAYWKWAIIAAHDALQGAMVCALADTTGTSVLSKASRKEMLAWLDNKSEDGGDPPQEWLASFDDLLEKCRKELQLRLEPPQLKDICRLHKYFRNEFAHFTPKGWSIEKAGLPRLIGAALDAVEDLMGRQPIVIHLDKDDQRRLKKSLNSTRASLGIT
jgi:hypothetical protein